MHSHPGEPVENWLMEDMTPTPGDAHSVSAMRIGARKGESIDIRPILGIAVASKARLDCLLLQENTINPIRPVEDESMYHQLFAQLQGMSVTEACDSLNESGYYNAAMVTYRKRGRYFVLQEGDADKLREFAFQPKRV